MMRPSSSSTVAHNTILWFGLCAVALVVLLALRFPALYEPRWYGDEGIFAAIAHNMRDGRALYSEAWDNKPPLIFVTYAATQAVFGDSVAALHAVATVSALATQATVIAIAWLLFGPRRALVAGLLFAFAVGTPIIEGNLAMTESFMILPSSLAMLTFVLGLRRDAGRRGGYELAAGVLFGIAAGYKQVAVFDAAAVVMLIVLIEAHPLPALGRLAAGFAAPQIVLAAVFLANGSFGAYWYAIAGSLGVYADLAPEVGPLERFAGYLPALLAVAYLVRRQRLGGEVTAGHLPLLWLGFALAGATSSVFGFPHYLQQAAPAAALLLVSSPLPRERDDIGRITLIVGGILSVAVIAGQFGEAFRERKQVNPVLYYRNFASHQWGTMSDYEYRLTFDGTVLTVSDISGFIEEDAAGDTAFAWGEVPWLYVAAGLTNPTRYYTSFLGENIPGAKREIMADLEAAPPTYVVVQENSYAPFGELERFIAGRYALLRAQGDWRLYRLTSASGTLEPMVAQEQRR